MMTNMSDASCILVLSNNQGVVSATVDALRSAGWKALGTTDAYEAMLLVSRHSISLVVQDRTLQGSGFSDLATLMGDDPVLREIPKFLFSSPNLVPASVEAILGPRLPKVEESRSNTRFVWRRKPAAGVRQSAERERIPAAV